MKKHTTLLLALALSACAVFAQTSRDYSVLVTAAVDAAQGEITLTWEKDNYATSYQIFRKDAGSKGWGNSLANLGANTLTWTDNSVEEGKAYEYYVREIGVGGFTAFGYVQAGIMIPAKVQEGNLLLLVESSLESAMPEHLDTLEMDLILSGWHVTRRYVDDTLEVTEVKSIIDEVNDATPLTSIYLFGHVPVPYSGHYCNDNVWVVPPDGHRAGVGDHCGAWAADVYYAIADGDWTDEDTTDFGARRAANKNFVGDNKWDQETLPGDVTYQLGRVDLSNMPAFGLSEVELLKQYVSKAHRYKAGITAPRKRGVIDENFGANYGAFASTAWRDFTAIIGTENILEEDYFTTVKDSNYLFAYGTGPGSYKSCGGVGTTGDFTTKNTAMFNYVFGSFFGDWDVSDNFLRAPLCATEGGLASAWVGRPWWHTFPMGLGENVGYCAALSQQNTTEYGNYQLNAFRNNIHVALMGDPTLEAYTFAPATNLIATVAPDKRSVDLSWTASTDPDVIGYMVLTSDSKNGPYGRLNSSIVTGTTFKHSWTVEGTNHYIVKAVKIEETPSGTFQNLSLGAYAKADDLLVGSVSDAPQQVVSIFPNPADDIVYVEYLLQGVQEINIQISDMTGKVVLEKNTISNGRLVSISTDGLVSGAYLINVNGSRKKLIIN